MRASSQPRSSPPRTRLWRPESTPGARRRPTASPNGPNDGGRMILAPGSTIGIVGGGQLGRMLAMAAAQLGYKCHVYAPDADSVAAEVSGRFTRAAFDDEAALARFAADVDVVTYEFENIPTRPLAALPCVRPPIRALETSQDRLAEKNFVVSLGGRPAPFAAVDDLPGLERALAEIGAPAILKTRRFGYDGKGQARIDGRADAARAWEALGGAPSILEGFVAFDAEFSVLLCRGTGGETMLWDCPRNRHEGGILVSSGATDLAAPRVEMANLVGEQADEWSEILADPAAHLHLYGKGEARPGRKMGHVTRLLND